MRQLFLGRNLRLENLNPPNVNNEKIKYVKYQKMVNARSSNINKMKLNLAVPFQEFVIY